MPTVDAALDRGVARAHDHVQRAGCPFNPPVRRSTGRLGEGSYDRERT